MEFGESEAKTKIKKRNDVSPCYQLWQVLMVDVHGNMYPCGMGVWKEFDPYLTIGNIQYKECTLNTSDLLDIEKRIARYDWRFANETEHVVGNE